MPRRTMNQQTLQFQAITWQEDVVPLTEPTTLSGIQEVRGRPHWVAPEQPYWEFDWQLTPESGLRLTHGIVRNTQTGLPISTESVFEEINFTDLQIAFDRILGTNQAGSLIDFDLQLGFSHPESRVWMRKKGVRQGTPPDPLFQYGLILKLINDFNGTRVTLRISIVFRGSANDFDPGNIPVAMKFYPQIGWTWERTIFSGPTVNRFRGSIRITVNNRMEHGEHSHHAEHGNAASLFADSNTSLIDLTRPSGGGVLDGTAGFFRGYFFNGSYPSGWGMVFDYGQTDLTTAKEYPVVYGPQDTSRLSNRERVYRWPPRISGQSTSDRGQFVIQKQSRQGYYDNIHIHARMSPYTNGDTQIHAPFCGHSCIHLHWRWSYVSTLGAGVRSWKFKGWSQGVQSRSNTTVGAPLIPHNQKLIVAICVPNQTRFSEENILNSDSNILLHGTNKMIWYCVDIYDVTTDQNLRLNSGEQQVIMEQEVGWSYRYANPVESTAVNDLISAIEWNLTRLHVPILNITVFPPLPLDQAQMSDYFETIIYPRFRYIPGTSINQIPSGTWNELWNGPTGVRIEEL